MFVIRDNITGEELAHYTADPKDWDWDSHILGETREGATVFSKIHVFSTRLEAELAKERIEKEFQRADAECDQCMEIDFSILKVEPVRGYKLSSA